MKGWCLILFFLSLNLCSKELEFLEALDLIMKNDTYIPPMQAYLESEKTNRLAGVLNFLPTIDTGYKKNYDYGDDVKSNSLYVSTNLNLFKGGADYYSLESRRYAVTKLEKGLMRLEMEREKTAVVYLINMILYKRKLHIQKEMVDIKQRALQLAESRYQKGFVSHDDVLKAQVDYKNTYATFYSAQIDFQNARKDLTPLLGDYEIQDAWPWSNRLAKMKDLSPNSNEEDHPRILELTNQYKQQQKLQSYYKGLLLPSLDFNVSWQKNEILKNVSYDRVGVLTLSWPLFDGLFKWSNYKAQSAEKVNMEFTLIREKRQLKEELKNAKEKLHLAIETAKQRDETLKLSKNLYQKNAQRYNQGKISITDLEWEQNRLLVSENLACDGWALVHINLQEFCHSNGKLISACF